jgi:hypothetical protein
MGAACLGVESDSDLLHEGVWSAKAVESWGGPKCGSVLGGKQTGAPPGGGQQVLTSFSKSSLPKGKKKFFHS